MELEIIIDNFAKKDKAERKIRKVAQELGVKILTEEELAKFAKRIDQKYKNNSLENKNIIPPSAFNEYLVQDDGTEVETTTMGVARAMTKIYSLFDIWENVLLVAPLSIKRNFILGTE